MNRDDIIRMAREAGGSREDPSDLLTLDILERFAALVYEYAWKDAALAATRTVIDAAVLAEREACCSIVYGQCGSDNVAQRTVDAIRARVNK